MQCHCQKCRKANGSTFAANAAIPTTAFTLLTGKELLAEYDVFRVFCKQCASPFYRRRPNMPELLRLRIGTLDTKIEGKPSSHIFVGSKAEWYEICDDIPQYEERPVV